MSRGPFYKFVQKELILGDVGDKGMGKSVFRVDVLVEDVSHDLNFLKALRHQPQPIYRFINKRQGIIHF
jgi:hypothetical protein